ncbi:MAG: multicopper oxidase domain-containing protein [Chloroflexi bacterium]|nr:multicopper oxidase domain-containing protein [Chloroflexota bacterium]
MNGMGTTGMCGMTGMGGMAGMGGLGGMGMGMPVTLMTVTLKGNVVSDNLPDVVNPDAKRPAVNLATLSQRTLVLSMNMSRGYINGQDFDVRPLVVSSKLDKYEVWQIVNYSMMDHPFHLHMTPFQVLSINGGDLDYTNLYTSCPAWKDVVVVPGWGSATLLVPVKDFTGMAMFHCHILEHEDIGMMGMWEIADGTPESTGTMGDRKTTEQAPGDAGMGQMR